MTSADRYEGLSKFRAPVPADKFSDEEVTELVDFLKVLADKTRLRILGLLSEREYTVKEMATVLGLKEPTISAHLGMLTWRGMVNLRQEGTSHFYSLRQEGIFALLKDVTSKAKEFADAAPDSSEFERRVLQHFFENGKLKEIPQSTTRQMVVLRHLVKEFEPGARYTEKQVNETLKRYHLDCATLRRLMVDYRLMARENSVYWRLD